MCRLALHTLQPRQLVLDVGTGSGILGIWAARKRNCRVVCIDVSRRALRFSKANALRNSVPVAKRAEELRDGHICFLHCSFENLVRSHKEFLQQFNIVFLNPPFNPTCAIVSPALHASAGPDAQTPFKHQIRLVPEVLKVGGYCIGYQMSYDSREGQTQVLPLIQRAYRSKCRILYAHVLQDKKQTPVEPFLRAQYSSFLRNVKTRKNERKELERYIKRIGGNGQFFSLIYYEVKKEHVTIRQSPREMKIRSLPQKTWTDRIWLHKCIVDHASI